MALAEFLDGAAGRRTVWGNWDCCQMIRAWIIETHGVDPAFGPAWRYRTETGAALLCGRHGGLEGLIGDLARQVGLPEADDLQPGDIGVIEIDTPHGRGKTAALYVGGGWVHPGLGGLTRTAGSATKAWRV